MAEWARRDSHGSNDPHTWARRLKKLRSFTRWLQQFEPRTEVPDDAIFGRLPERQAPHIYSEAEIVDLLAAARRLGPAPGLRGIVFETLFGLIACTGLRISRGAVAAQRGRRSQARDADHPPDQVRQVAPSAHAPEHRRGPAPLSLDARPGRRVCCRTMARSSSAPEVDGEVCHWASARCIASSHELRQQLGWRNRGTHHAPRIHDLRHNSESRIIPSAASNDAALSEVSWAMQVATDARNYQRPFRKSITRSLGRKRGIGTFLAVVLASARSFSCMSACR